MIKLVASDIDGTLKPEYQKPISDNIYRLLSELADQGVRFCAASGRQIPSLKGMFYDRLGPVDLICENGALVYADGKLIHKSLIPDEIAREIISVCEERQKGYVLISGVETSYVSPYRKDFADFMKNVIGNQVTVLNHVYEKREDYFKISIYDPDRFEESHLEDFWKRRFGGVVSVAPGGFGWVDMMPFGTNKGTAIRHLMDYRGIKASETMAFGDNFNDLEMLLSVGQSYAMASAPWEIRKQTTGTCTDVGEILEELLNKRKECGHHE